MVGPISFDFIDITADRAEAMASMRLLRANDIRADLQQLSPDHHRIIVRFGRGAEARVLLAEAVKSNDA